MTTIAARVKARRQILTFKDVRDIMGPPPSRHPMQLRKPRLPLPQATTPQACPPPSILVPADSATQIVTEKASLQVVVGEKAAAQLQKDNQQKVEDVPPFAKTAMITVSNLAALRQTGSPMEQIQMALAQNKNLLIMVAREFIDIIDRIDTSHGDTAYFEELHDKLEHMLKAYDEYIKAYDELHKAVEGSSELTPEQLDQVVQLEGLSRDVLRTFCITMKFLLSRHDVRGIKEWQPVLELYKGQLCAFVEEELQLAARDKGIIEKTKSFVQRLLQFGQAPVTAWNRFVQSRLYNFVAFLWRHKLLLTMTATLVLYTDMNGIANAAAALWSPITSISSQNLAATGWQLGSALLNLLYTAGIALCYGFAANPILAGMFVRQLAEILSKFVMPFAPVSEKLYNLSGAIMGNALVWLGPLVLNGVVTKVFMSLIYAVCAFVDFSGRITMTTYAYTASFFRRTLINGEDPAIAGIKEATSQAFGGSIEFIKRDIAKPIKGLIDLKESIAGAPQAAQELFAWGAKLSPADALKAGERAAHALVDSLTPKAREPLVKDLGRAFWGMFGWSASATPMPTPSPTPVPPASTMLQLLANSVHNGKQLLQQALQLGTVYQLLGSFYNYVVSMAVIAWAVDKFSALVSQMNFYGHTMLFLLGIYDDLGPAAKHDEHSKRHNEMQEQIERMKLQRQKELLQQKLIERLN